MHWSYVFLALTHRYPEYQSFLTIAWECRSHLFITCSYHIAFFITCLYHIVFFYHLFVSYCVFYHLFVSLCSFITYWYHTAFLSPVCITLLVSFVISFISDKFKHPSQYKWYIYALWEAGLYVFITASVCRLELEIVDQWSTRIPPPHRRGWQWAMGGLQLNIVQNHKAAILKAT